MPDETHRCRAFDATENSLSSRHDLFVVIPGHTKHEPGIHSPALMENLYALRPPSTPAS
jgi:hypothetical protein